MNHLITKWGRALDPSHVHAEYPRPLMVREQWESLNGYWSYAFSQKGQEPEQYEGRILVPFSPESDLSGVGRQLQPGWTLWYRRTFQMNGCCLDRQEENPADMQMASTSSADGQTLSKSGSGMRILLHFGAVDQRCTVSVNGTEVAAHTGGYLPFEADITEAVRDGDNTLTVRVLDDSDSSYHARGKQKLARGGMFYTATSGIWQRVWLEYVPEIHVTELKVQPDIDRGVALLTVKTSAETPLSAQLQLWRPALYTGEKEEILPAGESWFSLDIMTENTVEVHLEDLRLWTCDEPWLYTFTVNLLQPEEEGDFVRSYFAMRSFTLEQKDYPRICLNHAFFFQKGVLDQGYWPDGLLTPPSDEAVVFDLQEMKRTGFHMVRKHIKIESGRWYSHCDRLGLIVWQDMVNGGGPLHSWYVTYLATALSILRIRMPDKPLWLLSRQNREGREEFVREMKETIHLLENHPCICTWVIFNEGWGQFWTRQMTDIVRQEDPSRLIDQASGWFDQGGGDMCSVHNYFTRLGVRKETRRANVLSEFGGKALVIPEHSFSGDLYGYGMMQSREELNEAYRKLDEEMTALIPQGLCASVYTQWTDIEDEVNGIYTYDREVRKIDG